MNDGSYQFRFGTDEMGLDPDDYGISTSSKGVITDFNTLLEKIRGKHPEIYNLYPIYVHPDYTKKVINDLKFRQDKEHFDYEGWAIVLILKANRRAEMEYSYEKKSLAEEKLRTILLDNNT